MPDLMINKNIHLIGEWECETLTDIFIKNENI